MCTSLLAGGHFLSTCPRPSGFPETTCISLHNEYNTLFGAVGLVCVQAGDEKKESSFLAQN